MRAMSFILFFVLSSLIVKDVVGYAVDIDTSVEVKSDGSDEVSALQMLLQFTIGRKQHLCANGTLPLHSAPEDKSKSRGDDQVQIVMTTKPSEQLVNHTTPTTPTPTTTPTTQTAVPDPTTIPDESSSVLNLCFDDFIQLGDQCYYFNTAQTKWHNALKACQSKGATLAYPLNATENSLIVDHLRKNHKKFSFWIGGSDEAKEGTFVWAHDQIPINYANWNSGEPNDGGGVEDCLHLWHAKDWEWNDNACTDTDGLICQQLPALV